MRTFILSYNPFSESAKQLSYGLEIRRIKLTNTKYVPKPDDLLINWGNSSPPFSEDSVNWLNRPSKLREITNKLRFFRFNV